MLSALLIMFVVGILFGTKFAGKKDTQSITQPTDDWSFEPVDGQGWYKFTGEHSR